MVHQRCCIPCCRNDSRTCEKVISFHGIPKDPVMRKKWLQRIEFTEDRLKKHTKVCSLHFCPEDFEPYELRRRMLRKGVLPSRFLKDEDGLHALRPMRRRRNANKISKDHTASTIVNPASVIGQNLHLPTMSPLMAGRLMVSPNQIPFAFPFPYNMSPFLHPPMTAAQMNSLLIHNQMENPVLKARMESPQISTMPSIVMPIQSVHSPQLKETTHHASNAAIDLTQLKPADQPPPDRKNSQILHQPLQMQHATMPEVVPPMTQGQMMLDARQVKSQTSILWPMARLYRRGERHADDVDVSNAEVLQRQHADAALRQLTAQHQLIFASMNKQLPFPEQVTSIPSTSTQELNLFQSTTPIQLGSVVNTPDSLPPNVQQNLDSDGALSPQTCPKNDSLMIVANSPESDSKLMNSHSFSRQDSKKSLSNIISRLREKVHEDPSDTENGNGCSKKCLPLDLSIKDDIIQMVTIMKVVEQQDEHTTSTKLMIVLPPKECHTRKYSATAKEPRQIVLKVVQKKGAENRISTNDREDVSDLKDEPISNSLPMDLSVREEKWFHTNGYAAEANMHGLELRNNPAENGGTVNTLDSPNRSVTYSKQLYQLPLMKKSSQNQDEAGFDILQMLSNHDNPTQLLEDQEFTLRLFKFVGNASSCKILNSSDNIELSSAEQAIDLSTNGSIIPYSPVDGKSLESGNHQLMTSSEESLKMEQNSNAGEGNKNWNKYRVVFDKRLKVLHAKEAAVFYETVYKFQMPEGMMDEAYILNNFSIQKVPLQEAPDKYVYFCNKCVKTLMDLKTALDHVKKHSERKRFKCKSCSKTYSSIGMIESHVERYVPPDEKKLECEVCTKKFAFRGSLMMHLKLAHRDMEEVRCNLCHKEIKRHYLNTHMKRHRNERPHKCNICGKGFVAKKVLTTHLSIHTGYKPYKCQYCGRGFTVKSNMQLHERTHTGDRPFICTVCGKDFINRGTLKGHMFTRHQINLGKVHKCRHCTDSFTRLKTLVEHMEKVHKHLYCKDGTSGEVRPQATVQNHVGGK